MKMIKLSERPRMSHAPLCPKGAPRELGASALVAVGAPSRLHSDQAVGGHCHHWGDILIKPSRPQRTGNRSRISMRISKPKFSRICAAISQVFPTQFLRFSLGSISKRRLYGPFEMASQNRSDD